MTPIADTALEAHIAAHHGESDDAHCAVLAPSPSKIPIEDGGRMASKEEFAKVIGRAVLDSEFAAALIEAPDVVGRSLGVKLDQAQVQAIQDLSLADVHSSGLRDKLGAVAVLDQQQQQAQMA